jgi:hypothetical protein
MGVPSGQIHGWRSADLAAYEAFLARLRRGRRERLAVLPFGAGLPESSGSWRP